MDSSETCRTRSAMPLCQTKLIPRNRQAQFMTMNAESGLLIVIDVKSCVAGCNDRRPMSERRLVHSSVRMRIIVARTVTRRVRLKTVPEPPDEKKQDETSPKSSDDTTGYETERKTSWGGGCPASFHLLPFRHVKLALVALALLWQLSTTAFGLLH